MTKKLIRRTLAPLIGRCRPGNAVMFHIGRCGSTVVARLLSRHSKICWGNELYAPIFSDWRSRNNGYEVTGELPNDAIDILRTSSIHAWNQFYGFEMKPFHFRLIGYSPEVYLRHLRTLGFTHFVVLDRRNRLRKVISSVIAHQQGKQTHIDADTKSKLTRVHLDVNEIRIDFESKPLLDFLVGYDDQLRLLNTLLQGENTLRLTYEDDIQDDPRVAYSRICNFLGLPPEDSTVELSRTNPFPIREMVENFQELEQTLQGTPYEWMIDD